MPKKCKAFILGLSLHTNFLSLQTIMRPKQTPRNHLWKMWILKAQLHYKIKESTMQRKKLRLSYKIPFSLCVIA